MSYCEDHGKDKVIFVTEEDHKKPSTIQLGDDVETEPGLIKENGEINWNCPCLGGMAAGPCGYEFRQAFTCFHYSEADPKGSNCIDEFRAMQTCMAKYPTLYDTEKDNGDMPSMDADDLDDPELRRDDKTDAKDPDAKVDTAPSDTDTDKKV